MKKSANHEIDIVNANTVDKLIVVNLMYLNVLSDVFAVQVSAKIKYLVILPPINTFLLHS